jgi:hypothetical protein
MGDTPGFAVGQFDSGAPISSPVPPSHNEPLSGKPKLSVAELDATNFTLHPSEEYFSNFEATFSSPFTGQNGSPSNQT